MNVYERAHRYLAECGLMATAYRPTEPNGTRTGRALTNPAAHPDINPDDDLDSAFTPALARALRQMNRQTEIEFS